MSNIKEGNNEEEVNDTSSEILNPEVPHSKVQEMFHELEIMAMQKNSKNSSLDLQHLSKEQIDKVLETMDKNEDNAFNFHSKRLDAYKEIRLKEIDSSVISQKTTKYISIGGLAVLAIVTLVIIIFKTEFFIPWLTFLTGLAGGFGIGKGSKSSEDTAKSKKYDDDLSEIN
ncbi:hypothetical protein GWA97_09370 [Flavobacterium sp. LaA7.5]|nr:hypothetical protein [Flavobacterium salilacus subsp. altitudinum]